MEREQHAVLVIFVPSEAPSAVVIVPHDGEEEGKPGFSAATRGAAPGPRCRRSGECPGATWGASYLSVVGGEHAGEGLGGQKLEISIGRMLIFAISYRLCWVSTNIGL